MEEMADELGPVFLHIRQFSGSGAAMSLVSPRLPDNDETRCFLLFELALDFVRSDVLACGYICNMCSTRH